LNQAHRPAFRPPDLPVNILAGFPRPHGPHFGLIA
jgi:hypothetical protein